MKNSLLRAVAGVGLSVAASVAHAGDAGKRVVVLELFTSEGCSSCPPADRVLSKLAPADGSTAVEVPAGTEVYALSYHVDYWNNLGWTDRFSSPGASRLQREYAGRAGSSRVYTPQLIVNGVAEFVGSDEARARREIAKAAAMKPEAELRVSSKKIGEMLEVEVAVKSVATEPRASSWTVTIALVEDGLLSTVTSGENSGAELRHDHVVRGFVNRAVDGDETVKASLRVPGDVEWKRSQVVAFVQEASGRVVGAGVEK